MLVGLWFLCVVATVVVAEVRGRSAVGWFLVALLLGPLGLIVLLLPAISAHSQIRVDIHDGNTCRYRGVRLGRAICSEDVEWVAQRVLSEGSTAYCGYTICEAGR